MKFASIKRLIDILPTDQAKMLLMPLWEVAEATHKLMRQEENQTYTPEKLVEKVTESLNNLIHLDLQIGEGLTKMEEERN